MAIVQNNSFGAEPPSTDHRQTETMQYSCDLSLFLGPLNSVVDTRGVTISLCPMNLQGLGFGNDLIFLFIFFNTDFCYNSLYIREKLSFLINQDRQVVGEQFCLDNTWVTLLILSSDQIYLFWNLIFRIQ